MAILTILNADASTKATLPNPSELQYERYDVDADGTGRNQSGTMFRDRVAIKRKITCKWPPMEAAEMAVLLQAVSDQFFILRFPDAYQGEYSTMNCYVGDRAAPAYKLVDGKWLWTELSMNFIER